MIGPIIFKNTCDLELWVIIILQILAVNEGPNYRQACSKMQVCSKGQACTKVQACGKLQACSNNS